MTQSSDFTATRLAALDAEVRELRTYIERGRAKRRMFLSIAAVVGAMVTGTTLLAAAPDLEQLQERLARLERMLAGPLTVHGSLTVLDAKGRKNLHVSAGEMVLFDERGAAGVTLVANTGRYGVMAGSRDMGFPYAIMAATNTNTSFKVFSANSSNSTVFLGTLGSESSKLQLTSEEGEVRAKMFIDQDQGRMDLMNQGRVEVMNKDGKLAAKLASSESGGRVQVYTSAGDGVGGLLGTDAGGSLALTGPRGGKTAVGLAVTPSGGKVRVFPAEGGTALAELSAESTTGAVTLYDNTGKAAAVLSSEQARAGRLELSNSAGDIVVQAGATKGNNIGFVTTGPYDSGVAGAVGGLKTASTIIGLKAPRK